jgi:hypothetical protein
MALEANDTWLPRLRTVGFLTDRKFRVNPEGSEHSAIYPQKSRLTSSILPDGHRPQKCTEITENSFARFNFECERSPELLSSIFTSLIIA